MSYRADDTQAAHRYESLAQQTRAIREEVAAELEDVGAALAGVAARLDRAAIDATRRRLRLIDRAEITQPCAVRWEDLPGDLRRRHCALCDRDVWDLSELSAEEGEAIFSSARSPCVRLTRALDGSVVTKDCGASPPPAAIACPMPAIAAGVAISASVSMAAAFLVLPRLGGGSLVEQARTDSLAVRSAVELYLAQDPGASCPTIERLLDERILNASTRVTDPWGDQFRIACDGDEISVISDGPDSRGGTEDDVP